MNKRAVFGFTSLYGLLLIAGLMSSCGSSVGTDKEKGGDFVKLINQTISKVDIADIDSVLLISNFPDDTIAEPPVKLPVFQTKYFIADLNKAKFDEICKYYAYFKIILFFKNGTQRAFRGNGSDIKENTDACFVIGSDDYFEKLYNSSRH